MSALATRGVHYEGYEGEGGLRYWGHLPITPPILRRLQQFWATSGSEHDTKLAWAQSCLTFLHTGELTVNGPYDPSVHLSFPVLAVDIPQLPKFIWIFLKQSMTYPFRKVIALFVVASGSDICPVMVLLDYLSSRGNEPGPLFLFHTGRPLSCQLFVVMVHVALSQAGLIGTRYCGHSFRIGAATSAAAKDSVIKTLERWESATYLQYVRIPRFQFTRISSILATP